MNAGFLFFLSLLGWALVLMLALPKLKAGHALLCSVCGMLFCAYYGIIVAQWMAPTAYVLLYGGLAALAIGLAGIAANLRGLRRRILTVGMGLYLLAAAAAVFLLRDSIIIDHDSLSYWLRIVKELFTYERFPINADSTMSHSDYIPLLASLQYAVVRVFGWQDASVVYVTLACTLASLAAIVDLPDNKLWGGIAAVVLLYAYTVFGGAYFSIRADAPMSALLAAGLLCLFLRSSDEPAAWLPTFSAALVLTGFKIYTGLLMALALALSMLFSLRGADKAHRKPLLWLSVSAIALCLVMQFSWSVLYHNMIRTADYEAAAAAAAYTGVAARGEAPVFSLTSLFSGNPRNEQLLSGLNAEAFQTVGQLIGDTFARLAQSAHVWLLLFLLPVIPLLMRMQQKQRKRTLWLLCAALLVWAVYLLGLFGSYFVQAETAPAAMNYLGTVSTPLLMISVMVLLKAAADGPLPLFSRATIAAAVAGMLVLLPPAQFGQQFSVDRETNGYSALAEDYYTNEVSGQLTPEDANRHALLIDCTYAASEIRTESGITYAYQYYGMPLYLTVQLYPYGDYSRLDSIDADALIYALNENRCDLLLLNIDDDLYWETIRDALSLDGDWDEPIAVYDVNREDGALTFHCRAEDE